MITICHICNKKFERKKSHIKEKNFCSYSCYHEYLRGRKHSQNTKEKMRQSHFNKEPWNKGKKLEDLYGVERANKIKLKISENHVSKKKHPGFKLICKTCNKVFHVDYKNRNQKFCSSKCFHKSRIGTKRKSFSDETRKKMSESSKGRRRKQSNEERKMRRLKMSDRFKNFDKWHPNFNLKACDYFEKFDKENNTSGRYAKNGGEFYIKELGYWVDYINHDLKLIIEWDEEKHYINNILDEKDKIRQQEIQKLYFDYEFRRIRENEYFSS